MALNVMKEGFSYDGRPWVQREFSPSVAEDIWDVHEDGCWATLCIWVGDEWPNDYWHFPGRARLLCREDNVYLNERITEYGELPLVAVDPDGRSVADDDMRALLQAADALFDGYLASR